MFGFEPVVQLPAELPGALGALARWDAASFAPELSPENARACWDMALRCAALANVSAPVAGKAPGRVLIIASANVFTAPLEWAWQLTSRGVGVILKPARAQEAVCRALAEEMPDVEVRAWKGGNDLAAETATLGEVHGVIAFGEDETLAALSGRIPDNLPFCAFGAKFAVAVVDALDATNADALAMDAALYDGRGCMSPIAVFARTMDRSALADALERAETRWPRGTLSGSEGVRLRSGRLLGRSNETCRFEPIENERYAAFALPAAALGSGGGPRQLVVHPWEEPTDVANALRPFGGALGTMGTTHALAAELSPMLDGARRWCSVGKMQMPPGNRPTHDGVAVLSRLWGAR